MKHWKLLSWYSEILGLREGRTKMLVSCLSSASTRSPSLDCRRTVDQRANRNIASCRHSAQLLAPGITNAVWNVPEMSQKAQNGDTPTSFRNPNRRFKIYKTYIM